MSLWRLCPALPLLLLALLLVPAAAAWDVQNLAVRPSAGPLAPGTPVTVNCTVHFDSYMTGSTFESENTLDMYTELENPRWSATLTIIDEDTGNIVNPLPNKQAMRYRIDGWTLNYVRSRLDLAVRLEGIAPNVPSTQDKIILRVQEMDPNADVVRGAGRTVKYQVGIPTPVPTMTTTPPHTAVPTSPPATAPPATPTVKQTYSPGPEPVLVTGLLGLLVGIPRLRKKD